MHQGWSLSCPFQGYWEDTSRTEERLQSLSSKQTESLCHTFSGWIVARHTEETMYLHLDMELTASECKSASTRLAM